MQEIMEMKTVIYSRMMMVARREAGDVAFGCTNTMFRSNKT